MAEKQYTRQAQEALNMARKIAAELKHPYVGTEHLLFGLKRVFTGVAGQVLDKNKVDEEQMEKAMDILVSAPEAAKKERKHLEYSPRLRYILEESQNEAAQLASEKVEPNIFCLQCSKMEIVGYPYVDDPECKYSKTFSGSSACGGN
ncbi:MAG: Clp protease N-terminal domain-containing protein [Ruminococcus sp.]|uniref:Clp protease N-terminal domain-containing protein n=1 Tax=Ruminococcus sp. TaxID=41978 RepID=UPI00399173C1